MTACPRDRPAARSYRGGAGAVVFVLFVRDFTPGVGLGSFAEAAEAAVNFLEKLFDGGVLGVGLLGRLELEERLLLREELLVLVQEALDQAASSGI